MSYVVPHYFHALCFIQGSEGRLPVQSTPEFVENIILLIFCKYIQGGVAL